MATAGGQRLGRANVPAAKLAAPQPVRVRVQRNRLLGLLDGAGPGQLVLLSAPAGHGKTMLLADWAATRPDRVAWVSLDASDRSDATFWTAVVEAILGCSSIPGDSALHSLGIPAQPSSDLAFMAELTAALAALPTPLALVLDDLHRIGGSAPITGLDTLLGYLQVGLTVIVSSRSDPTLPLARLRVEERLIELRASALAFTAAETRALLELLGLDLTDAQSALVYDQTAGWAAGVRLAAMSLQETDDREAFLADLVGNDRAIADYLVSEVLSRMAPDVRDLLSRLCVCEQVSAPLAVELSGNERAAELLTALEQDSSLVVGHGPARQWFRVHPLLRAYLKADLRRRDPGLKAALYERAARWHSAVGDPLDALSCAVRSTSAELVGEVLGRHSARLLSDGRHAPLRAARSSCSIEVLDRNPKLCYVLALAYQESGELEAARELAEQGARHWPHEADRELLLLRSLAEVGGAWLIGEPRVPPPSPMQPEAGRTPEVGEPRVPPPSPMQPEAGRTPEERAIESLTRAAVAAAGGDTAEVRRHAVMARRVAREDGQRYLEARALMLQATADSLDGLVRRAGSTARLADEAAPPELWRGTSDEVVTATFRSYDALMQGEPVRALSLVQPALRFASEIGASPGTLLSLSRMIHGAADIDSGRDPAGGLSRLRAAREDSAIQGSHASGVVVGVLWEHEAALEAGRSKQALDCRDWLRTAFPDSGEVVLLSATAAVCRGRLGSAQAQLAELMSGRRPCRMRWALASAAVLGCSVALRDGRLVEARRFLRRALEEGAAAEVLRPLLKAPAEVVELMQSSAHLLGEGDRDVISVVLGARGAFAGGAALTAREQEILGLLAMLRSLDEIAGDLCISANTVKSHVKAIYAKLGVNSRREAIATAQRRGLLPTAIPSVG